MSLVCVGGGQLILFHPAPGKEEATNPGLRPSAHVTEVSWERGPATSGPLGKSGEAWWITRKEIQVRYNEKFKKP